MKNLTLPALACAAVTLVSLSLFGCSRSEPDSPGESTSAVTESVVPIGTPPKVSPESGNVVQGKTFLIRNAKGKEISHQPAVVFTPDGKQMLSASSEGDIAVFEAESRKLVKRIKFPEKGSDGVSIDKSGRYAIWALRKGGVAVMEIKSEKIVARDMNLKIDWVAASPDGKTVAVSRGKELEIRELKTLKLVKAVPGQQAEITTIAWSSDGKLLGSTAKDGRLLVYDVAGGRKLSEMKKAQALYALDFRPGNGHIAYGGHDKKVYQYDFETKKEVVISKSQPYWITCLGYSSDGERLAVGDESCDIWLFQVDTKKLTFHGKHHVECWLNGVTWTPDNRTFTFSCRPNSHAGRPHYYHLNGWNDAIVSEPVRASRKKLLEEVDKHLGEMKDGKQKEALGKYRELLAKEGEKQMTMGDIAVAAYTQFSSNELRLGATIQAQDAININSTPAPLLAELLAHGPSGGQGIPKDIPEEIRKLVAEHQKTIQAQVKWLNEDNFSQNCWEVAPAKGKK